MSVRDPRRPPLSGEHPERPRAGRATGSRRWCWRAAPSSGAFRSKMPLVRTGTEGLTPPRWSSPWGDCLGVTVRLPGPRTVRGRQPSLFTPCPALAWTQGMADVSSKLVCMCVCVHVGVSVWFSVVKGDARTAHPGTATSPVKEGRDVGPPHQGDGRWARAGSEPETLVFPSSPLTVQCAACSGGDKHTASECAGQAL